MDEGAPLVATLVGTARTYLADGQEPHPGLAAGKDGQVQFFLVLMNFGPTAEERAVQVAKACVLATALECDEVVMCNTSWYRKLPVGEEMKVPPSEDPQAESALMVVRVRRDHDPQMTIYPYTFGDPKMELGDPVMLDEARLEGQMAEILERAVSGNLPPLPVSRQEAAAFVAELGPLAVVEGIL